MNKIKIFNQFLSKLTESANSSEKSILEGIQTGFNLLYEDISLGSANRESTNKYSGTDYTKAFSDLHTQIDQLEQVADNIYRINKVAKEDQIITNVIPLIDKILNTYMSEMQDLETAHADNAIPVLRTGVVNVVNQWIANFRALETYVNQHRELAGHPELSGSHIIGKFIDEVYHPAVDYTGMIGKMIRSGETRVSGDKLITEMKPIISEISALQKKFFDSVMGELKAATEGGAYLKGKATPELATA